MLYPKFESLESRALLASSISGIVFDDANFNGVRSAHEAGLARQRVYLDTNSDGKFEKTEPSLLTDTNGKYNFTGLAAGTYSVRVVVPQGQRQTAPAGNQFPITTSGNEVHAANDFGLTTTGVVRGFVFNDINDNGKRKSSEPGIAGVVVYIDTNGNGQIDTGERSRTTNLDGAYRFAGLKPGKYTIRIVQPGGTQLTSPTILKVKLSSGQSISAQDWGLA